MFGETELTPLWIADMDFKVAPPITKELQRIVNRGMYAYEFNSDSVYQSIVDWNLRRNQLDLNPEAFVQVSGALTGIALLIRELTETGDPILVQSPVYHQFYKVIRSADRKIVDSPLKIVDDKYQMDLDDIEQKLKSSSVKIILLCNPHNPVGRAWTKEELQELVNLAQQYGVTIISDEIHSDIIYSNAHFHSLVSVEHGENHIAILGSPAKTFAMHSISNGYLYIPNDSIRKQISTTIDSMYLDHGNVLSDFATIAAYNQGEDWLNDLISYLENTIQWITDFVKNELPCVKLFVPESTYQIWLDFSKLDLCDSALKHLVTQKAKLALTPGEWFGDSYSQFMRMNIASPLVSIQEAFYQLKTALDEGVDSSFSPGENSQSCCG